MKKLITIAIALVMALSAMTLPAMAQQAPAAAAAKAFLNAIPDTFYLIQPAALHQKMQLGEEMFLLDVRRPAEWATGRLEGAVHIPLQQVLDDMGKLPADKNFPIFVYCKSGVRSSYALSALMMAGYKNVINMVGGIDAWRAANLPVVNP